MEFNENIGFSTSNLDSLEDLDKVHGHYWELSEKHRSILLAKDEEYYRMTEMPLDPLHPVYYHVFRASLPDE